MQFTATPITMYSEPNVFAFSKDKSWTVCDGSTATLWFFLGVKDDLNERRYISAVGSSLQVTFERSDEFSQGEIPFRRLESEPRDVVKTATVSTFDRSLYSVNITVADSQLIRSGSVTFAFTENSNTNTWTQSFFIKKTFSGDGF